MDQRVRPLVFTVRRWAKELQLDKRAKTNCVTNFQLTCLVISFLQKLEHPILPTVKELIDKARDIDARQIEDDRRYSFLQDLDTLQFKTTNTSTLEELFMQFLEFYGKFDFANHLISLSSTKEMRKIEYSPLQIANPFEVEQNWARNVTFDECRLIQFHAQETLSNLIYLTEQPNEKQNRWGLLEIFRQLK